MLKNLTLLLLSITFLSFNSFAQKKDPSAIGQVKGILMDSAQNYVLVSGTVAVYTQTDTTLAYQLTNNFGEFSLKGLPMGVPLKFVATYIGYQSLQKNFTISKQSKLLDLKGLNMNRSSRDLEEVVISGTPAPVTLNGDTLEFNAAAFKLDKNAVIDDLLRKLPGVTVWSDGKITVNGKDISTVTVDGKPFFGGDIKIATENLPKNSVDKIQIFSQVNENNLLDSTTSVNIKLKESKRFGRFGKLSSGIGTGDHFEADAMLNFFNKRTQFGTVAASNNINKVGREISQLMQNASYKGVGAKIDYQPDFNQQGISQPNQGGFLFQHDFLDKPDHWNNNRATGNYYFRNNTTNSIRNTESTVNTLRNQQLQTSNSENETGVNSHNLNLTYDKRTQERSFYVKPAMSLHQTENNSENYSSSSNEQGILKSTNSGSNIGDDLNKSITIAAGFNQSKTFYAGKPAPKNFDIKYRMTIGDQQSNQHQKSQFMSVEDASQNKYFDRTYRKRSSFIDQNVDFDYQQLGQLIFKEKLSKFFSLGFQNTLTTNGRKRNDIVNDIDSASRAATLNSDLSLNSNFRSYRNNAQFIFQKQFFKAVANRFYRNIAIRISPQILYFSQRHRSEHDFQNITQRDLTFLPKASISYYYNKYNSSNKSLDMNYTASKDYPTIDQLVPLPDNSNQYFIFVANPDLKPSTRDQVTVNFSSSTEKQKHPFRYNIGLNASKTKDMLTDSLSIDELGRRISNTVNINGSRSLGLNVGMNKAYKLKDHQVQLNNFSQLTLADQPSYINDLLNNANTLRFYSDISVEYTFKDTFVLNLKYNYSSNKVRQRGARNDVFDGTSTTTGLSGSYKINKSFTVNSNINLQRNSASTLDDQQFTLWNASMNYRFLKEKTLEFKFTALDLLRQNKSIYNYAGLNGITRTSTNVLQQYFMCTIAYYPRKMGK